MDVWHRYSILSAYASWGWGASRGVEKVGWSAYRRCGYWLLSAQAPPALRALSCAHRVWCVWCSMIGACSTRSSSSWTGGGGAGQGTASWTLVSGEQPGTSGAAFWLGRPCGWGGLSPAPCLPPHVCRCATVHRGDRAPGAALPAQHGGVSLGPKQEDLRLPAGESQAGTGRRLEV